MRYNEGTINLFGGSFMKDVRVAIIGQGRSGRNIHGAFFRSESNTLFNVVSNEIDEVTGSENLDVLMNILKMLHPFMPYVTEEIYSMLPNKDAESIMISEYPKYTKKLVITTLLLQKIDKRVALGERCYNPLGYP